MLSAFILYYTLQEVIKLLELLLFFLLASEIIFGILKFLLEVFNLGLLFLDDPMLVLQFGFLLLLHVVLGSDLRYLLLDLVDHLLLFFLELVLLDLQLLSVLNNLLLLRVELLISLAFLTLSLQQSNSLQRPLTL